MAYESERYRDTGERRGGSASASSGRRCVICIFCTGGGNENLLTNNRAQSGETPGVWNSILFNHRILGSTSSNVAVAPALHTCFVFAGKIMEGYDYDAVASTIKVEDITSNDTNRKILRKLKANDAEFDDLVVVSSRDYDDNNEYCPEDTRSLGWLGYYIGKNTKLQGLILRLNPLRYFHNRADIEDFFRGVNCNRSIQEIHFHNTDISGGGDFPITSSFLREQQQHI